MSQAAKALILTWVLIGLFIAGAVGFYLGRRTAPKAQGPDQVPMIQLGPAPSGQPNMSPQSPPPKADQKPQEGFQKPPLEGNQQQIPPSPKP